MTEALNDLKVEQLKAKYKELTGHDAANDLRKPELITVVQKALEEKAALEAKIAGDLGTNPENVSIQGDEIHLTGDAAEQAGGDGLVTVVLSDSSPVGRLVLPEHAPLGIERAVSARIPVSEFERLKDEYSLVEVTEGEGE